MKRGICISLLIVLLMGAAPLFAQQSLISGYGNQFSGYNPSLGKERYWTMPLIFDDDTDAFMDPNDFRAVEFGDFFTEVQAGQNNGLSGGIAKEFGSIYTSLFFDGSGNDFVFGNNNALSLMIGTDFAGAFKPFFVRTAAFTQFGLNWGMNIESGGRSFKPEVMLSYSNEDAADYSGLINAGGALGIDFAPAEGEASLDLQYELKFGLPQNSGFYHEHYAIVMYRRLYDLTGDLSAGWGLGAAGWFADEKIGVEERWGLLPAADFCFKYQMGDVFGIYGQFLATYTLNHTKTSPATDTSYIGGFNVVPMVGAAFTPYGNLKIELGAVYDRLNANHLNFTLLASFKK
jgi:hypothetical protein